MTGGGVDPHPVGLLEVHEQHADASVAGDVAHRQEHAVAVVARERQRGVVDDPHEAGGAALVRHRRVAAAVDRAEEEERPRRDERLRLVVEGGLHRDRRQRVGDGPAVEPVLERALLLPVERIHVEAPASVSDDAHLRRATGDGARPGSSGAGDDTRSAGRGDWPAPEPTTTTADDEETTMGLLHRKDRPPHPTVPDAREADLDRRRLLDRGRARRQGLQGRRQGRPHPRHLAPRGPSGTRSPRSRRRSSRSATRSRSSGTARRRR